MSKIELPNVTLVSVTSVNVDRTIRALKHSMGGINFGEVILLTDKNVTSDVINVINVPSMDYVGYSKFIVYELHRYINTDFALIIQDDGFVVNPQQWTNEFLNYDYIGAPFPIPHSTDKISYRDPQGNLMRVGNGGFSFRSRKLLSLPTKLDLEWKSYFGYYNEDGFFAVHNHEVLKDNGCVFAPVDIAARFSHEKETVETVGILPFGFHGKSHKYFYTI